MHGYCQGYSNKIHRFFSYRLTLVAETWISYYVYMCAKFPFLTVYFYAHFKRMHVRNFLTEPDRDIFIENKNVPYCQISPNILKKKYWVCRYAHARAQLFKGAR